MAEKPVIGTQFEDWAHADGYKFIAGIDEVGRGCLAGPVVAAAVILDFSKPLPEGLDDSKKLNEKKRDALEEAIKQSAVSYAIAEIPAQEIDQINILQATKRAMVNAINSLKPLPDFLLIDAVQLKGVPQPQRSIIKGDATSVSIAAASIIAKCYRDRLMREFADKYPQYGFEKHVGYGTKDHYEALKKYGHCDIHRLSFKGVMQEPPQKNDKLFL